jgi:hypothetical protein
MQHLIDALQADYELTIDWEGTLYCGLTIDWHYAEGYVDVHALIRPASPQTFSSPRHYDPNMHQWQPSIRISRATDSNSRIQGRAARQDGTTRMQQISGTFLATQR